MLKTSEPGRDEPAPDNLDLAIEKLPQLQRRIMTLEFQGIPIDSEDPDQITMVKVLSKSEKTIRTHRQKAHQYLTDHFKKTTLS